MTFCQTQKPSRPFANTQIQESTYFCPVQRSASVKLMVTNITSTEIKFTEFDTQRNIKLRTDVCLERNSGCSSAKREILEARSAH
jgi:hypothetical protein